MKLKLIAAILSLIIVANCGYKVVDQNYLDKYAFTEITINGDKMSKSLNNFITVNNILNKFPGEVLRYALLSTHYRSSMNWDMSIMNNFYRIHSKRNKS